VLGAAGAQGLPRGARVRVRIGSIDEITLDVHGTVIERLDPLPETDAALADDEADAEESELAAGPISIAVDMDDAQTVGDADANQAEAAAPAGLSA
jgi:exoribonuclease-2